MLQISSKLNNNFIGILKTLETTVNHFSNFHYIWVFCFWICQSYSNLIIENTHMSQITGVQTGSRSWHVATNSILCVGVASSRLFYALVHNQFAFAYSLARMCFTLQISTHFSPVGDIFMYVWGTGEHININLPSGLRKLKFKIPNYDFFCFS